MSNDLLKQIDDLVASKTFNLDALDGIKTLKDSLKKTLEERDALQRRYDDMHENNAKCIQEITSLTVKLQEQTKRVSDMTELANTGASAIWEKKIADASAAAYKDALYTVFKPSAVRETIQRQHSVWVPNQGGSGYAQSVVDQDIISREDV